MISHDEQRLRVIFRRLLAASAAGALVATLASSTACESVHSEPLPPGERPEDKCGYPGCDQQVGGCDPDETVPLLATCASPDAGDAGEADASDDAGDASTPDASLTLEQRVACTCQQRCNFRTRRCELSDAGDAVVCYGLCYGGRRPDGLAPCDESGLDAVSTFLIRSAHLEAASVDAFEILASELRAHGAPAALVDRAHAAARDEVAHAAAMAELAGLAAPPAVRITSSDRQARSLEAIAIENAEEGCVRELFAALVATRQGEAASDPSVRRVLKEVARDETRHAALSLDVAEWIDARLTADERARVARAKHDAVAALRAELDDGFDARDRTRLGLPSPAEAAKLLDSLMSELAEKAA